MSIQSMVQRWWSGRRCLTVAVLGGMLVACASTRISVEQEAAARLAQMPGFALQGERLAGTPGVSGVSIAIDSGIRDGMLRGMEARGFERDERQPQIVVDYLLSHAVQENEAGLASPLDYQRSWRGSRSALDDTGSMNHISASVDFFRKIDLVIEIRSSDDAELLWRGRGRRDIEMDQSDLTRLQLLLQDTTERILEKLPSR